MSKLLNKIQYTADSINDIQKALEELGANTSGANLGQYGDIIRNLFKNIGQGTINNKNTVKLNAFILDKDVVFINYLNNILHFFVLDKYVFLTDKIIVDISNTTKINDTYNVSKNLILITGIIYNTFKISRNIMMFSENDIIIKEE